MLRLKYIGLGTLTATCVFFLGACSKPPQRPDLSGPPKSPLDTLVLGRKLSPTDLKALVKVINSEGKFQNLTAWLGNLSESELQEWTSVLNTWVYENALQPQGLLQLVKKRIEANGFSNLQKELQALFKDHPELRVFLMRLVKDPEFVALVDESAPVWDPEILSPLIAQLKRVPSLQGTGFYQKALQLLHHPEQSQKLQKVIEELVRSELLFPLAEVAQETQQQFGEEAFASLGQSLIANPESLGKAVRLIELLNRPAEPIIQALQQGLQSNPDVIHALTLKWDPVFTKALGETLLKVLLAPEDGKPLDREFWLGLARKSPEAAPTAQFIRLYSIVLSALQKGADPRRLEPQADAGSYRLPLQLNALFITQFLEAVVVKEQVQLEALSSENFQELLWNLPLQTASFQLSLSEVNAPASIASGVRKDLEALGLSPVISRLESLLTQPDSGRQLYQWEVTEERSLRAALFQVVAAAHALKPMADITPVLFTLVQGASGGSNENISLEILKKSPNLLEQIQSVLAAFSGEQWKDAKRLLFEEMKLAQLETEDLGLIVTLFQASPEVAEWVGEVLSLLPAVLELDTSNRNQPSLFQWYLRCLGRLTPASRKALSNALTEISQLGLLSVVPEQLPELMPQGLQVLAKMDLIALKKFQNSLGQVLLKEEQGISGVGRWMSLLRGASQNIKSDSLEGWVRVIGKMAFSLSSAEHAWLFQFVNLGGLKQSFALMEGLSNKASLEQLVQELTQLSEQGAIQQGFRLLSNIQNERLRELALVVLKWDCSGELLAAFQSIQLFFNTGEKP